MKPSFALNFTDDGIQLLHRTSRGWVTIGDTPFDAPDLDDALDYMRKTALGLEPSGIATKLVIPNSQIRYIEVTAPGPSDDERRAQIRAALEGQTPYAVDDLVFDWSGRGKSVRVAVIARETLAEAEGFAAARNFNPLGFVAIPDYGDFTGEPWFGETSVAASVLPAGETVERDKSPVRIINREVPKPAPKAGEKDAEPEEAEAQEAPAKAEPAPEAEAAPEPQAAEAKDDDAPAASDDGNEDAPVAEAAAETTDLPKAEPAPVEEEAKAPPAPQAAEAPPATPAKPEEAAEQAPEEPPEAPFTHVPDTAAFPEAEDDIPPLPGAAKAAAEEDDDLPPAPSAAAMVAFSSRRGLEAATRAPALGGASRPDPGALARAARGKPVEDLPPMPRPPQAAARPTVAAGGLRGTAARGIGGLVTGAGAGAKAVGAKVKGKAGNPAQPAAATAVARTPAAAAPADAAKSLTRPGGTFGNRPPDRKSRTVLFLSLVAVLLLCLALVAAWASYFLASQEGATGADTAVAAAPEASDQDLPAIEDEMLADGEEELIGTAAEDPSLIADAGTSQPDAAAAVPEDVAVAAEEPAATEDPVEAALDTATAAVEPTEEIAVPEPAPGTAVSSDNPPAQALDENQDEIFLATSDSPPPALDALSLPTPEAATDALPGPQMPPPPFGTVYAFDENGLLKPTPEGILSPEGVMLIAGKPPRIPPSRSEVATAAAAEAAEAAAALAASPAPAADTPPDAATAEAAAPAEQPDPDLADRRPRARPEGLATSADDAALAVEPEVTFASLRPRARPAAVLAAGERARQETAAASLAAAAPAPNEAEAQAELAAAAAAEAANPSVVAISRRPAPRPKDFDRAVEAAVAAAIRAPEPPPEPEPEPTPKKTAKKEPAPDIKPDEQDEINEPEVAASAAPKIPTKASVAKQATFKNALNLSKINLIGVYGTQSKRYALIRQANGKYKKVKVGDRIDGGKIEAITQNEVRYQKGGRLITLKMPKG